MLYIEWYVIHYKVSSFYFPFLYAPLFSYLVVSMFEIREKNMFILQHKFKIDQDFKAPVVWALL